MNHPGRPLVRQQFFPFSLTVHSAATPMKSASQQTLVNQRFTAFTVSVFSDSPRSVYLGDGSVSAIARNGIEIGPANSPVTFSINNERQLYEVQGALLDAFKCLDAEAIPFVVWDPSTIYFSAAADTNIGIILFAESFT